MIHNQSSGKNRLIKKIISLGIAFLLICSVIIPAFAADVGSDGEHPVLQAEASTVRGAESQDLSGEKEQGGSDQTGDSSDKTAAETGKTDSETDASAAQEETGKTETEEPAGTVTPQPDPAVTYNFYVDGNLYGSQTIQNGGSLTKPEVPAAEGKVFGGWYTTPEGDGQKFDSFGTPLSGGTETVMLYGRWENGSETEESGIQPEVPAENGDTNADTPAEDAIAAAEDADIAVFSISGPSEVEVGSSITLTSGYSGWYNNHSWTSSNSNCAAVEGNEAKATVTGIAEGTVTITHVCYGSWNGRQYSDTYEVTVTGGSGEEGARVYYLKTPTSNPDSNDVDQWGENVGTARVNTDGASWTNDKNVFSPSRYVVSWPDGTAHNGVSWLMPKAQYGTHYQAIYNAYKTQLESELGVTLEEEDIEAIYLTPYKISRNNYTNPDKHIDCTISVKTKSVFAAVFWVTDPDGTVRQVDAKNYKTGDAIQKTAASVEQKKTVDGVTYVFDGWYNEAGQKVSDAGWPYAPNGTELNDGTVNFYAKYIPENVDLEVSKTVTGALGDRTKDFGFTVTVTGNGSDLKFKIGDTEYTGTAGFTLRDSQTVTLSVPAGAAVTVTEADCSSEKYTTSYAIDGSSPTVGNAAVIGSVSSEGGSVAFTNHKDVIPDTGLNLTGVPYILMLALTAAGGFLLISRRKRRI